MKKSTKITSLIIILFYVLGLFLPIIKNTKESKIYNQIKTLDKKNFSIKVFKKKNSYDKILEIGAGSAPHLKYLTHSFNEYHIAETSDYASEIFDKNLIQQKIKQM